MREEQDGDGSSHGPQQLNSDNGNWTVTLPMAIVMMLLMGILTTQVFMFSWMWRIDKFLVVLAVGSEKLAMYSFDAAQYDKNFQLPKETKPPKRRKTK